VAVLDAVKSNDTVVSHATGAVPASALFDDLDHLDYGFGGFSVAAIDGGEANPERFDALTILAVRVAEEIWAAIFLAEANRGWVGDEFAFASGPYARGFDRDFFHIFVCWWPQRDALAPVLRLKNRFSKDKLHCKKC